MADAPGLETHENSTNNAAAPQTPPEVQAPERRGSLLRTLLLVGVSLATVGLIIAIVRAALTRTPADPTTERIQALIDEANRLLKALDDKNAG